MVRMLDDRRIKRCGEVRVAAVTVGRNAVIKLITRLLLGIRVTDQSESGNQPVLPGMSVSVSLYR